ncbi:MAG: hypothetical protein ACLPVY_17430 [Acidimicrobiia bacterium]
MAGRLHADPEIGRAVCIPAGLLAIVTGAVRRTTFRVGTLPGHASRWRTLARRHVRRFAGSPTTITSGNLNPEASGVRRQRTSSRAAGAAMCTACTQRCDADRVVLGVDAFEPRM